MRSFSIQIVLLCLLLLLADRSAKAADFDAKAVDAIVTDAMKSWEVPGAAIAILSDGKEVYLKGHGVRDLDGKDRVTPDTLFPLASCSKAFTTTAMAMLVDDGKMSWDDPVRKHVDFFHLGDPLADGDVRLRDLLCHRTGLHGHDLLWYHAPWSPEESVRRAGLLPLDQPFRTRMQYQSTMFSAAGLAVSSASGKPWDQFIRERICEPLDMKSIAFTSKEAEKTADRASGHRLNRLGHPEPMPSYPFDHADPAISIQASASDLSKWLRFQLGDGTHGAKRLVSAANLAETHTPQMVIGFEGIEKEMHSETNQMSYGLAWVIYDYRGEQIISHGGVIDGIRVQLTMLPKKKIGIVILCNLHRTYMTQALTYSLLDRLLGSPKKDWNEHIQKVLRKAEDQAAENVKKELAKRHQDTKPSRELSAYAGSYEHAAYGTVRVALERGQLVWTWNRFSGALEHFHYDTFVLHEEMMQEPFVQFVLDNEGKVSVMKVSGAMGVEFKRTGK
jgi:CubicO group peptidase (beta-lactamase class C family)